MDSTIPTLNWHPRPWSLPPCDWANNDPRLLSDVAFVLLQRSHVALCESLCITVDFTMSNPRQICVKMVELAQLNHSTIPVDLSMWYSCACMHSLPLVSFKPDFLCTTAYYRFYRWMTGGIGNSLRVFWLRMLTTHDDAEYTHIVGDSPKLMTPLSW